MDTPSSPRRRRRSPASSGDLRGARAVGCPSCGPAGVAGRRFCTSCGCQLGTAMSAAPSAHRLAVVPVAPLALRASVASQATSPVGVAHAESPQPLPSLPIPSFAVPSIAGPQAAAPVGRNGRAVVTPRRWAKAVAATFVGAAVSLAAVAVAPMANAAEWQENDYIKLHLADLNGPKKVVRGTELNVPMIVETFNQSFYKTQYKNGTFTSPTTPGCAGSTPDLSPGQQATINCTAGPIMTTGTAHRVTVKGTAKRASSANWHDVTLTSDRFFTVVDPSFNTAVSNSPAAPQAGSVVDVALTFVNDGGTFGAGSFEKLAFVTNHGVCGNQNLGAFNVGQTITVHCNIATDPWDTVLDLSGTALADLPGGAYSPGNFNGTFPTNVTSRTFTKVIPLTPPPAAPGVTLQLVDTQPNGWTSGSNIAVPINVTNTSASPETISVTSPLCSNNFGTVPAGETRSWTCTIFNATNTFDLYVTATASTGGAPITTTTVEHFVVLPVPAASVNLQLIDIQPNGWAWGSTVTVPIAVTNTSTVPETITVSSVPCSHNFGVVPPGASLTWDCAIYNAQASFVLSASATASTGGAPFTQWASEYFLVLPASPPTATASIVDSQPNGWTWGAAIPVPITVSNTGSSSATISVSSPQCSHNFGALNPGQSATWTCVIPTATASFQLSLAVTASNAGGTFTQTYTEHFVVAAIQVTITDDHPGGWPVSTPITAPVSITNPTWGTNATNVTVQVLAPFGATCAPLSATSIPAYGTVTTTCTIPAPPAGASVPLVLRVTAEINGIIHTGERTEVFVVSPNIVNDGHDTELDGTPGDDSSSGVLTVGGEVSADGVADLGTPYEPTSSFAGSAGGAERGGAERGDATGKAGVPALA